MTIAKIVFGLVFFWVMAWTPYTVVSLLGISGYSSLLTPLSSMLPALFAKTAACVDPFIYSLNHPKIRQEILCRLYNCFLLSTGRRTESGNSDSARVPEWKISGSARAATRQGMVYHNNTQHTPGRLGSLASSRRLITRGQHVALSVGGGSGRDDVRRSVSFSSADSRTVHAEGLDTAELMASLIQRNNELNPGVLVSSIVPANEMSGNNVISTSLVHTSIKPHLKQKITAASSISSSL